MGRTEEMLTRLKGIPSDYTYRELVTLMSRLGFSEDTKSGGSHMGFVNSKNQVVGAYRPHEKNTFSKSMLRQIVKQLVEYGVIENDRK